MKKSLLVLLCALLAVSCGVIQKATRSSEEQTIFVTIYGSGDDQKPDNYFKFLPDYDIGTGSRIIFCENTIGKGLVVYLYHFDNLFSSAQDISVIEIDPRRYIFRVADHKGLKRTSEMAIEAGGVAAMNGTFYDMKKGGSVCYLQIDGVVADTTKGKDMKIRANGAVVIMKGKLSIEWWNQAKEDRFEIELKKNTSVMATMPLLINDGYAVELPYYKGFSDKRHPRSVVFEKDGKICLMVIDGRSKGNAAGMTLDEVQRYLLSLDGGKGCQNAVNLDGGGSSTLWLKPSSGEKYSNGATAPDASIQGTGVINHPSDNGKFDHKGERRVANSIIVLSK